HVTYPLLLPWVIPRRKYRILLSHNSYTTFTALSLAVSRGVPYLMQIWDPISYILDKAYETGPIHRMRPALEPLGRWIDRLLLSHAAGIVLASDRHVAYLEGSKFPRRPTFMIPPGCDSDAALPDRRDEFVLTVTAWKRGKQLEVLLNAMAPLDHARL